MVSLSRLLSSLLLIIALPTYAYIPDSLDYGIRNLSETQKFLIRNGQVVPYNKGFVKRVVVGKAKIMPNGAIINLPYGPDLVPSFHDLQHDPKWQVKKANPEFSVNSINLNVDMSSPEFYWNERERRYIDLLFWTTQILDVYSTYKGMKYDCLYEANPLLPEVPKVHEMVGLKLGIIGGVNFALDADENFWYGWKLGAGISTGVIVINNFRLLNKAERRCDKR